VPNPFAPLRPHTHLLVAVLYLAGCSQFNLAVPPAETQPALQPVAVVPVLPEVVTPVPKTPAVAPVPSEVVAPMLKTSAVAPVPRGVVTSVPEPPAPPASPDITRTALIVPLSGPAAALGQDLADAAQMALFDFAVSGFELRIYDSGGNTKSATAAAARAQADGVRLVLGPLFAEAVTGASTVTRAAGIPMFAFSNDSIVAGDGVYAAGFAPDAQIDRLVTFAAHRGLGRFAALAPDDGFGSRMSAILSDVVARRGGTVSAGAFYPGDVDALTDTVRTLARYDERVRALEEEKMLLADRDDAFSKRALERLETRDTLGEVGFDALMLPVGGDEVLQVAPLLAFFDIDPLRVKLLGTWVWDDPALGKEPAMLGAWFVAPPPEARRHFVARFEEVYGRTPDRLSTLAYDAVALAVVLARGEGADPYTAVRLENPAGFAGVDGIFRLNDTGTVERGLAVLEVRRDAPRVIDPAPISFAPPVTN